MIKEKNMYKPLSESLPIKQSKVNGLGLFAKEGIAQGTNFGMSHIKLNGNMVRTPLGGFINHSDTPNTVKVELLMTSENDIKFNYKKWNLITLRNIKKGEELTVAYTFYNV